MGMKKNTKKKNVKKSKKIVLKEELKKDIDNFNLMDDEFFSACFKDNYKAVTCILRIIFEDENLEIIDLKIQEIFTNFKGHSLQLDIIARNKVTNVIYNIEIQRAKDGASPERARYHVDIYDTHNLKKNHDFKDLPTTFVIFITETDVFKRGLPIYKIQRYFEDNKEPFNDRSYIYYVNGAYNGNDDIGKLVHDFQCKNPEKFYFEELAEKVRFFKTTKEGRMEISSLLKKTADKYIKQNKDKYIAKGKAEGEKLGTVKSLLNSIKSLMKNANYTVEQAMKMLSIPQEEHDFYLSKLQLNTP